MNTPFVFIRFSVVCLLAAIHPLYSVNAVMKTCMKIEKNFWQKLEKPILALAPMAGVNNPPFRLLCKKFGADVLYTEMISAAGLRHGGKKTLEYLKFDRRERPVVAQLFGSRPEDFVQAAKLVERAGFSGVDINFGCPARKVIKNKSGSALMNDLRAVHKIIEAACQSVKIPVSIKIRNSKGDVCAFDLVKKIEGLPVQAIMVHGRSFEQGFSDAPDWGEIRKIRKIYSGVLLANGGVVAPPDAAIILQETKADGLGLARVTWGRPWVFQQIKDCLKTGRFQEPSWSEKLKIILEHMNMAILPSKPSPLEGEGRVRGAKQSLLEFRKHLLWYARGVPGAANLRQSLMQAKSLEEIKKILKSC